MYMSTCTHVQNIAFTVRANMAWFRFLLLTSLTMVDAASLGLFFYSVNMKLYTRVCVYETCL